MGVVGGQWRGRGWRGKQTSRRVGQWPRGVLLAVATAHLPRGHSPFFSYLERPFIQESGCDPVISGQVTKGGCVTQFWPGIKGGLLRGSQGKFFPRDWEPPACRDRGDQTLKRSRSPAPQAGGLRGSWSRQPGAVTLPRLDPRLWVTG